MSFLDKEGLRYFWQGVKKKFYNKSEIDSQREELQKGIDDASKTGGVEVGTIVHIPKTEPTPEGYDEVSGKSFIQINNIGEPYVLTTTNLEQIPLKHAEMNIGDGFTLLENGTIKINKTMYIKAFAQLMLLESGTGGKQLIIKSNTNDLAHVIVGSLGAYQNMNNTSKITQVNKGDILSFNFQGAINDKIHNAQWITFMTVEEVDDPTKPIKKVSVTEVPKIEGSIVDTFNVDDKTTNAPSINAVENYVGDSLAEALMPKDAIYSTDLNDIIKPGCYAMTTNVTNEPPTVTGWGGFLIVFKPYTIVADVYCQLFVDANGSNIYIRTNWFGTWYSWKSLG